MNGMGWDGMGNERGNCKGGREDDGGMECSVCGPHWKVNTAPAHPRRGTFAHCA